MVLVRETRTGAGEVDIEQEPTMLLIFRTLYNIYNQMPHILTILWYPIAFEYTIIFRFCDSCSYRRSIVSNP
jgi:hypothetical protein